MKTLYSFLLICFFHVCLAQNFTAGGLNYQIISTTPPRVMVRPSNFSGNLVLPATVTNPNTNLNYTVSSIMADAFYQQTGITSVVLPNTITSIGSNAFYFCFQMSSVVMPSVSSIGDAAFKNCSGLQTVTLGSELTSVGSNAFESCSNLLSFTINQTFAPSTGTNVFLNASTATATLFVPAGALNTFNVAPWSSFGTRSPIPTPAPTTTAATQTFCLLGTIADLQVTGTNIKWYASATAITQLPTTTTLTNNTTYYATQTLSGQESTTRLAVTAIINTTPTASPIATSPQNVSANATLSSLTATGSNIIWYDAATAGSVLPLSTTLVNGTTYFASQTVNSCESTTRTAVVANVASILAATHLNFDGANDSVSLPVNIANTLSNGTELTIEYWFKGTSLQSAVRIQNGSSYIVAGWGTATPQIIISSDGGTNGVNQAPASAIYDNNWHHVAYVWKKNTIFATYLDGVLQNSRVAANVNLPVFSGTNTFIGSFSGTGEFLNGNLDDVRIWNVALTPSEIANRRSCELAGNEPGLIAYYKFNEGFNASNNSSITTVTDATSNAYNGTLTGFANNGTSSNWLAGSPVVSGLTIPVAPSAPQFQFVSSGATISSLTASGTNLKWYASQTGGSELINTTSLSTGTTYYVSQTSTCESSRTPVIVTFKDAAKALNFSGGDDRVRVADNPILTPTNALTIEFWTRSNSFTQPFNMLVSKTTPNSWSTGYFVYWESNGKLGFCPFGNGSGTVISTSSVPLNTWTHVAATYDGTSIKIYINGVLDGTVPITGVMTDTTFDLFIGSDNTNTYTAFGDIDMVRIWSTARTQAEITSNITNCIPLGTAGLIAQYDFEEQAGSTLFEDTSGNNLHGTYNNMEVADWITGDTCGATLLSLTNSFDSTLKIYPNPSNAIFNIEIESNATALLFDIMGRKIASRILSSGTTQIDLSYVNSGIYLLQITNDLNQIKVVKLIKE